MESRRPRTSARSRKHPTPVRSLLWIFFAKITSTKKHWSSISSGKCDITCKDKASIFGLREYLCVPCVVRDATKLVHCELSRMVDVYGSFLHDLSFSVAARVYVMQYVLCGSILDVYDTGECILFHSFMGLSS